VVVGCVVEVKDQTGNSEVWVDVIEWDMDTAARLQVKVRCVNSVDVVNSVVKDQTGNSEVWVDVIEWDMDTAAVSTNKDQSEGSRNLEDVANLDVLERGDNSVVDIAESSVTESVGLGLVSDILK
jgi:hypothetical protein